MPCSASAISNLALKVTDVLSCNKESAVSSFVTSNGKYSIREPWIHYQLEEITKDLYLKIKER